MNRPGTTRARIIVVLALTAAAGCQRSGEVVLSQPAAPPSQREMTLKSDWTFTANDGGRRACLLAFPLPRAVAGARDFLIYLTFGDATGVLPVRPDQPDGVRGFLIQAVGELTGKCEFVSGTVRVRKVLFAPRLRRLDLDVRCDDDTRIRGTAYVEQIPRELQTFERRYANDVAALSGSFDSSESPRAGTAQRPQATDSRTTNSP